MGTEREWAHKDEWRLYGRDFVVTVEHRAEAPRDGLFDQNGGHRWAVYAYVYPAHPLFSQFALRRLDGTKMVIYRSEDCLSDVPLHGGCSLVRPHHDAEGKVTSVQFGADYGHLHDARFSFRETFYGEIKDDAEALFNHLAQMAAPTATEASRE